MNLFELYAKISVDDTGFVKSMKTAQKATDNVAKAIKELQSPLDRAKDTFSKVTHPVETAKAGFQKLKDATESLRHPIEALKSKVNEASSALETKRNKLSALSSSYDSAKKKVEELTKEFNKSAKESGTSSKKTQELAKELNDAEHEAEQAKKELDDYSASVSKAGKKSDSASKSVGNFASKLGKGLATTAKIGATAIGVASTAIASLTALSINSFAEYEQLVGGAQKIFDQMDYSKIAQDAGNAYKELGLSANQYLAVMNDVGATFAATMGDEAGYEAAKTGLKAISDYASGTGKNVDELSQKFTLITRSTSSYQSIADQFSGILPATSAGFLEQAQAAGILSESYTELTQVPIDEYQAAVSKMLEQGVDELGLANNTMNEAFNTLSGSLSMAKSAWSNLVTGLASDSADLDVLISNFVESVGAVAGNLVPKIGTALNGIAKLVSQIVPKIIKEVPKFLQENLPLLVESAISLVESIIEIIQENKEMLFDMIFDLIAYIAESFLEMLPQIVELGLDLIVSLAEGLAESIPTLIPTIISIIQQIVATLTEPETLSRLFTACLTIIKELGVGLGNSIPQLVDAALDIIDGLVNLLLDPKNIESLLSGALEIVLALGEGLVKAIPRLLESVGNLIWKLIEAIIKTDWRQVGKNIIAGIREGIAKAWENLREWFSGLFGDLIGIAKKILGIASPSKVFKRIGVFTAEGFGVGFEDEFGAVKDDIEKEMSFDNVEVGAKIHRSGSYGTGIGGNTYGDIIINIDGAKYSNEKALAEAVSEQLQSLMERREAVYA